MDRALQIELVRRTHGIYCGLKGVDVALVGDVGPGRTDCATTIWMPLEDPESNLIHKHEWQHIFFKTDLVARAAFVDRLAVELAQWSFAPRADLSRFLHLFANALDDLRVCSLWELIYPFSAMEIQERWRRTITETQRWGESIMLYTMGTALGLRPLTSPWARYHSVLSAAGQNVRRRGFPVVLVETKKILDAIFRDIDKAVEEGRIPNRSGFRRNLRGGGQSGASGEVPFPSNLADPVLRAKVREVENMLREVRSGLAITGGAKTILVDTDVAPSRGTDEETARSMTVASIGMQGDGAYSEGGSSRIIADHDQEVLNTVERLRGSGRKRDENEELLHGTSPGIFIQTVTDTDPAPLLPSDRRIITTLRQTFAGLQDVRIHRHTDSGSSVDPTAYMDMVLGGRDTDIFEDSLPSQGFYALLLIDMSGSMRSLWPIVDRTCAVIAQSLKFPNSEVEVWGFSGEIGRPPRTNILRFTSNRGFSRSDLGELGAWGFTPLHRALEVAANRLVQKSGAASHLIVVTDGCPNELGPRTKPPMHIVAEAVDWARKRRVNVTGVVLGDEVTKADADLMFGRKHWRKVDESTLFKDLTGLMRDSFSKYLQR